MEISRPGSQPLSPEQQRLFESAREQLHHRALNGGLTSDDIRRIVAAVRTHPEISYEVVQLVLQEAEALHGADPALRLLNLEE